ncbi:15583_t:CDS:1, partial [Acaulospora morrowiae]
SKGTDLIHKGTRCYASAIQLPFHPHYVPLGKQPVMRRNPTSGRKKGLKSSYTIPSWNLGVASQNKDQVIGLPAGVVGSQELIFLEIPSVNNRSRIVEFGTREKRGDQERKIPILFRISTICFVVTGVFRNFYRHEGILNNDDYGSATLKLHEVTDTSKCSL